MSSTTGPAEQPLITFLMVTNGRSPHLKDSLARWASVVTPGKDFFVCGPAAQLRTLALPEQAIVDHPDSPEEGQFFRINFKKCTGAQRVPGQYVYLLHDRLLPPTDIVDVLTRHVSTGHYQFGALDVNNPDGSPSLRDMRLDQRVLPLSLNEAMRRFVRLGVSAQDAHTSEHVALNGAQFFLRRDLIHHLERPLRWFEMEDDVLSFDLRNASGIWISETALTTCVVKRMGKAQPVYMRWIKRVAYTPMCLHAWMAVQLNGHHNVALSVLPLSERALQNRLTGELLLIDPLHKITATDVLPTSLEKLMARARLMSNGRLFGNVTKVKHGWRLH